MSSMFNIILSVRLIRTTGFDSTILMTELEEKVSSSTWSFYTHNDPNSGYFHKIFGVQLKKGSWYFYTNKFLQPLLYFRIYNPFPNRQISSIIGAQAHL